MKYLKKWRLFENHDDINRICKEYGIENYTINRDGSIDVVGNVDLQGKGLKTHILHLTKLPLKFSRVSRHFYCHNNQLTSLRGAPLSVGGHFSCYRNKLTSLEGAPKEVGGIFSCSNNQLINLDHLPNVSGDIYMNYNPVYSIVHDWIEEPERRWEKWEYFQDLSIIQGNKVIVPRLEEFHEVMEIPMPDLEEIKKYYTIVE